MPLKKQPVIASILITAAMLFIALFFEFTRQYFHSDWKWWLFILFTCIAVQTANYYILNRLFGLHTRQQFKKLSELFPKQMQQEADTENVEDLYEMGQKFSRVTQKHHSELISMKELDAYRKEYVGNVAHELKTPLFAIQGYAETLRDGAAEDPAIREKYLERISLSVDRLLSVVSDLDMINKYESGEIKLTIEDFDLISVVREVFEVLEVEAEKSSAELVLECQLSSVIVMADRQRIFQVFLNLIANAIHYAQRENPTIKVRIHVLESIVFITVEDNGMGIKKENLNRIFERFYRIESSRTRREGGSGLGLAIVKHILEAHDQKITVESEYLEGTTFSFMLNLSVKN